MVFRHATVDPDRSIAEDSAIAPQAARGWTARSMRLAREARLARIRNPRLERLETRWLLAADFGDAPLPYPTLAADGGAFHEATGPRLGDGRDDEPDGLLSLDGLGDGADEDGVRFLGLAVAEQGARAVVAVRDAPAGARLDAWVDFNRDGDWSDAAEQIAADLAVHDGQQELMFNVPLGAVVGDTFARFRLSTSGGLAPTGGAPDGEVEDYRVEITEADLRLRLEVTDLNLNLIDGAREGEQFLLRALTDDLRNGQQLGVFAAYVDIAVNDPTGYALVHGEVQQLELTGTPTGGSFRLSFGGETTEPISPFEALADAAVIQSALESLSAIGAGNVLVTHNPLGSTGDRPFVWRVRFVGQFSGVNVSSMLADGTNLQGANQPDALITELIPGDESPFQYASAFAYGPTYPHGRQAVAEQEGIGEAGAFQGLSPSGGQEQLLWQVVLQGTREGTLTFDAEQGELVGSEILLFGEFDVVDPSRVDFGSVSIRIDSAESSDSDLGDAPAPYPSLLADDGARHLAIGPRLGATRDVEADGQPSPQGDADTDDGVTFGFLGAGKVDATAIVDVQNAPQNARLDAWIDFNQDGQWDETSERIADSLPVAGGVGYVRFAVPGSAEPGRTFARFRISTDGGLGPTGAADDGEVEDYAVDIEEAVVRLRLETTDLDLNDVEQVQLGEQFLLRAQVQDVRETQDAGVFAAYMDVVSDAAEHYAPVFGEIQSLSLINNPIGGVFTLSFGGETTGEISFFQALASPLSIQSALEDLPTIGEGNVVVGYAPTKLPIDNPFVWDIHFVGEFELTDVPSIVADGSGLIGAGNPAALVTEFVPGHVGSQQLANAFVFGASYPNGRQAELGDRGLENVGAFAGISRLGGSERLLWQVVLRATGTGPVAFVGAAADGLGTDVLVFDSDDAVSPSRVDFGSTDILVTRGDVELDFGDAPAPYPTRLLDDGARHVAIGPILGISRDGDDDGQPSDDGSGDGADDDGVLIGSVTLGQSGAGFSVIVSNAPDGARLAAWIDYNADGDWNDPNEFVALAEVANGLQTIPFDVPATATTGPTFARFRLSTAGEPTPTGEADDGEVEDYRIVIEEHAVRVRLETTDLWRAPQSDVSVGDSFLLRAHVRDLRGVPSGGVFAAYMDVVSESAERYEVVFGEVQTLELTDIPTGGSLRLAFDGQFTSGISPLSAFGDPLVIQTALENLDSIGVGNVVVDRAPVSLPSTNPFVWEIRFVGALADIDVDQLVVDASGLTGPNNPTAFVTERVKGNLSRDSFRNAFMYGPSYANGKQARSNPAGFDDVGAFAGTSALGLGELLLWQVVLTARQPGTVAFSGQDAGGSGTDVLVYGSDDPVDPRLVDFGATEIVIVEPGDSIAPRVVSVDINSVEIDPADLPSGMPPTGWSQQRSRLSSVRVTFDEPVNLSVDDLVLTNLGVDAPVDADTVIALDEDHVSVDGNVLLLTFDAGELPDGVYRLDVLPTVTDLSGNPLDGDGDGVAGDGFVFQGSGDNAFHQLLTDWNGDGGVSIFDFVALSYWFGATLPAAPEYMDLNDDLGVSIFDFVVFSQQFGRSATYPPGAGFAAEDPAATLGVKTGVLLVDRDVTNTRRSVTTGAASDDQAVETDRLAPTRWRRDVVMHVRETGSPSPSADGMEGRSVDAVFSAEGSCDDWLLMERSLVERSGRAGK